MSNAKTKPESDDPRKFISQTDLDWKWGDATKICDLMERFTDEKPMMWAPAMIDFGSYHCQEECGREGDWFLTGFSLRRTNFSIYMMAGFRQCGELLAKLEKHKLGHPVCT